MNTKNIISIVSPSFIFVFVFSFFNDNFMVNHFGENSLKLLFILFFLFYGSVIIKNLRGMTLFQDKIFFLYAISLTFVFLIENVFDMTDDLISRFMTVIALFTIIIYFSRYPLERLLYFIWLSMMFSVGIAYFSEPLTEWTFRTTGGTGDPNEFAAQLLAFLFTGIYLFNINKSKIFLLSTIVFFTYAIFVAGSKSSFLMLAIVGILTILKYIIFDSRKILNYKSLIIFIVLLFTALQIDFTEIQAVKSMQERAKSSHTFDTRLASWNGGYHMTAAHPLIGVGLGDYGKYTRKYATVYVSASAPHNLFMQLVGESGVIVFLIFLIFLMTLFIQNFKIVFKSNYFWVYIAFLSLLFMGMSLGILFDKYFLLYIAIMLNTNYLIRKGDANENIAHHS